MNFITKIYLLVILFSVLNFAQEISVCESYTENGIALSPIKKLEIKPYGKAVYVLINNKTKFDQNVLYLFIDKMNDGQFTPFDSKTLNIKKEDKWAVTSFEFRDAGVYELYFLNSSQKKIAAQKLEVKMVNEAGIEHINPNSRYNSGGANFIFCDMIVNDKPINPFTQLSLSHKNGQAYAYINNYVPLNSDIIIVKVWKRDNTGSNSDKLVYIKKYKVEPQWNDTFFKLNFNEIGEYKIEVFNKTGNLISSNNLNVIN